MDLVFTLRGLRSVGTLSIYELTGLSADHPQRDIVVPPGLEHAEHDVQDAFEVVSDPAKRLGWELLARGHCGTTTTSVLLGAVSPWSRLMRGIALLRDAEDAEARGAFQECALAWTGAIHDLVGARGRTSFARVLVPVLRSWGLDGPKVADVAHRVDTAIRSELLPFAHLRALLRWPISNDAPDELQKLHLWWALRMPDPVTRDLALAWAHVSRSLLVGKMANPLAMAAKIAELTTVEGLDPEISRSLASDVARRVRDNVELHHHHWYPGDIAGLQELFRVAPPTFELGRCLASGYAREVIASGWAHDQEQVEQALWSLALEPRGARAGDLDRFIDAVAEGDTEEDQPKRAFIESFVDSRQHEWLVEYRFTAMVEEASRRLGADEFHRPAVHRLLAALESQLSIEVDGNPARALREQLGPTCGLTAEQWDVVERCLVALPPGEGVEGVISALPPAPDPVEAVEGQLSTLRTGPALEQGGLSGAPLRWLCHLASSRDWFPKMLAAVGLLLMAHGALLAVSNAVHEWRLDGAYERLTEAGRRGDQEAALRASVSFLELDDEPEGFDPRRDEVMKAAMAAAQSQVEGFADSSDGYASLVLLEEVAPVLTAPGVLPELHRQVDQVVLQQASGLASSGQDDEVERLLARRAEVVEQLDSNPPKAASGA